MFKEYLNDNLNTNKTIELIHELLDDIKVNDLTKLELLNNWDKVLGLNLQK